MDGINSQRRPQTGCLAELKQVIGMSAQLYQQIAPVVTVIGKRPLPNQATAPPLVVAAMTGLTFGDGPVLSVMRQSGGAVVRILGAIEMVQMVGIAEICDGGG